MKKLINAKKGDTLYAIKRESAINRPAITIFKVIVKHVENVPSENTNGLYKFVYIQGLEQNKSTRVFCVRDEDCTSEFINNEEYLISVSEKELIDEFVRKEEYEILQSQKRIERINKMSRKI